MVYTRPTRRQAHRQFIREHLERKRRAERKEKEAARDQLFDDRTLCDTVTAEPRTDRDHGTHDHATIESR